MPVFHCGPWSQLAVFLVVPEVSLLDRLVPSNGEYEQSEALGFLNFWGKNLFFFTLFFGIYCIRKGRNRSSFLSVRFCEMCYTGLLILFLIIKTFVAVIDNTYK